MRQAPRLRPEIRLPDAIRLAPDVSGRESLLGALQQLAASEPGTSKGSWQAASAWVSWVRTALAAAQWATHPSSYVFLLKQRWEALLDEVCSLDVLGAELDFGEFAALLREQVDTTVFAPESCDASVQILGPLEAAGQTFDAVWVLHCGDLQWSAPRGAALLPSGSRSHVRSAGPPVARPTIVSLISKH